MIKVNTTQKRIRACTAPYIYVTDKGEEKTEEIRVRYFSLSGNEARERYEKMTRAAEENPNQIVWHQDALADIIESLPDLKGPDGKPFAVTAENLGTLDTENLAAIKEAIDQDRLGKSQSAK